MRVVKKMVVTPARSLQNDDLVAEYGEVFFFCGEKHTAAATIHRRSVKARNCKR